MSRWSSCRWKPDLLPNIQGQRKVVKADFVCICFVTKHHYTALPRFSFSLFYSLLFSVHIVNVNTAKSCTVLDTYTYTYIQIYIYIFFFLSSGRNLRNITCLLFPQHEFLADWEFFFFFTKALRFKQWVQGGPMTCALNVSSLRLSACFIYNKRA